MYVSAKNWWGSAQLRYFFRHPNMLKNDFSCEVAILIFRDLLEVAKLAQWFLSVLSNHL
jgi:hypothetical protein